MDIDLATFQYDDGDVFEVEIAATGALGIDLAIDAATGALKCKAVHTTSVLRGVVRRGDLVLEVDGKSVDLRRCLSEAGRPLRMKWLRPWRLTTVAAGGANNKWRNVCRSMLGVRKRAARPCNFRSSARR